MRGEMVDIGGRRLHLIREGPPSDRPPVLLEAGAFGFSADFGVVQERLAARGRRVLAYDRAGLGASDPGPPPRDGLAVVGDLETLLAKVGEAGPFILVGHSMAGLYLRLFAGRNPEKVAGLVLVDATTPESTDATIGQAFVGRFIGGVRLSAAVARSGVYAPLSLTWFGDKIGLTAESGQEKRRAFASPSHHRWSADEVSTWFETAAEAKAAGPLDPRWPVAVVTASRRRFRAGMSPAMLAPAEQSDHGYVEAVEGASHTTLLGRRYADAVLRGVEHVRDAWIQSR